MTREIKNIEWLRYQDASGRRFWWHPDDEPPKDGTLITDEDFGSDTMLRVRLDPPIEHGSCVFDELSVLWSELQCCNFLLAHGVVRSNDAENGRPEEMRVSVNLLPYHSTAHGYFYCRNDDFNKPFIRELCKRELLVPTGRTAPSGFIEIPLFRFTPWHTVIEDGCWNEPNTGIDKDKFNIVIVEKPDEFTDN